MAVEALQMQGMRGELPARGPLRVRPMLRSTRGPLRLLRPRPPRRRGAGSRPGPDSIWRYADFLPFETRAAHGARGGSDAARPGRPARRAARTRRGLGQERHREPDALLQGPRRHRRDREGAGARLPDRRLRLDRQPRQLRRGPRRGRRPRLLRVHPVRPRGAEDPRDGHLRHEARGRARQLRRRQPPLHRALRRARVGVREREHEAVLRRGLEDPRLRDRRAARLGAARPGRRADRVRFALHQDRPRLRRVARGRPDRRRPAGVQRRLRPTGCSPVAQAFADGRGLLPAGEAGHDRQVARDRQPGRRPVRARARAALRRRESTP